MSYGITYERLKQQHNGNPEVNHTVLQMRALKEILAAGGSYEEICECISLSAASASMPGSSTKIQSPGNQDSSFSSCSQFPSLSTNCATYSTSGAIKEDVIDLTKGDIDCDLPDLKGDDDDGYEARY